MRINSPRKFVLLLFLTSFASYASDFQELNQAIVKAGTLQERIDTRSDMVWYFIGHKNDSAVVYIQEMLEISEAENYPEGEVKALEYRALYFEIVQDDYEAAFQDYQKALNVCEEYGLEYAASINHSIGGMFHALEDYEKAAEYYQIAYESCNDESDKGFIKLCVMNLGIAHSSLKNYEKAEVIFHQCLDLGLDYPEIDQVAYSNLANLYYRKQEYEKGLEMIEKSFDSPTQNEYTLNYAYLLKLKSALGDISGADTLIRRSVTIAENEQLLREKSRLYKEIGRYYEVLGNSDSALYYNNIYIVLSDSLKLTSKNEIIQNMEQKYRVGMKEEEIKILDQKNRLQEIQIEQNRTVKWGLIIIACLLLALLLAIFARYRIKAKTNAILRKKNEELEELNAMKDKLFSIISHDLKSPVSAFKHITAGLSENFDALPIEKTQALIGEMKHSASSLYLTLNNLLEWSISQQSLQTIHLKELQLKKVVDASISFFQLNISMKELSVKNAISPEILVKTDENILQTIIRNILMNAIKFSEQKGAIRISGDAYQMSIRDAGVGISKDDLNKLFDLKHDQKSIGTSREKGSGIGLVLCKELIEKQGGEIELISELGKGTNVIITFEKG